MPVRKKRLPSHPCGGGEEKKGPARSLLQRKEKKRRREEIVRACRKGHKATTSTSRQSGGQGYQELSTQQGRGRGGEGKKSTGPLSRGREVEKRMNTVPLGSDLGEDDGRVVSLRDEDKMGCPQYGQPVLTGRRRTVTVLCGGRKETLLFVSFWRRPPDSTQSQKGKNGKGSRICYQGEREKRSKIRSTPLSGGKRKGRRRSGVPDADNKVPAGGASEEARSLPGRGRESASAHGGKEGREGQVFRTVRRGSSRGGEGGKKKGGKSSARRTCCGWGGGGGFWPHQGGGKKGEAQSTSPPPPTGRRAQERGFPKGKYPKPVPRGAPPRLPRGGETGPCLTEKKKSP